MLYGLSGLCRPIKIASPISKITQTAVPNPLNTLRAAEPVLPFMLLSTDSKRSLSLPSNLQLLLYCLSPLKCDETSVFLKIYLLFSGNSNRTLSQKNGQKRTICFHKGEKPDVLWQKRQFIWKRTNQRTPGTERDGSQGGVARPNTMTSMGFGLGWLTRNDEGPEWRCFVG